MTARLFGGFYHHRTVEVQGTNCVIGGVLWRPRGPWATYRYVWRMLPGGEVVGIYAGRAS